MANSDINEKAKELRLDIDRAKTWVNGTDTETYTADDGSSVNSIRKQLKHLQDTYNAKEGQWGALIQNLIDTVNANPSHETVSMICAFPTDTSPAGWLKCNGASVLRSSYPALFTAIGIRYGNEDNLHFSLPDLRGYFLRGIDDGSGRNPDPITNNIINTAGTQQDDSIITLNERVVNSPAYANNTNFPEDQIYLFKGSTNNTTNIFSIGHRLTKDAGGVAPTANSLINSMVTITDQWRDSYDTTLAYGNSVHMNTSRKGPRYGQPETRPKNVSVNWCIKY